MSGDVNFRPARAGDEPGIAAVHWAARRLAYKDILPPENLDGRTAEVLTQEWVGILKREDGAETLVAEALMHAPADSSFEARLRRAPQDEEIIRGEPLPCSHREERGSSFEAGLRRAPEDEKAPQGDLTLRCERSEPRRARSPLEPRIVGFVTGGPVRERKRPIVGDLSGVTAEVSLLYVLPEEMGWGLGRALFGRGVERLVGLGHEGLVVWAYRANPYTSFYERLGGVAAAESDWEVEGRFFPTRAYIWRDLQALVERCMRPSPSAAREREGPVAPATGG